MEKFAEFIIGKEIVLETDHKPLVPLLRKKSLDLLPPQVLRFRLRLTRFQYTIHHVPGKTLYTADTLSRAPSTKPSSLISRHSTEVEQFIQSVIAALPASSDRLDSYSRAQATDQVCFKLIEYCKTGWPARSELSRHMKDYWRFCGDLTLSDKLLLYQSRIVIPASMQQMTLEKIHLGHQGIQRCRLRVFFSLVARSLHGC